MLGRRILGGIGGLIFGVCAAVSAPAHAVDGYKGLKFGDSKTLALSKDICSFDGGELLPNKVASYHMCGDYLIGTTKTTAAIYFINEKFFRLAVVIPDSISKGVFLGLMKKYGEPTGRSKDSRSKGVFTWDDETIEFRIDPKQGEAGIMLVYTIGNYDLMIAAEQARGLGGDL